MIALVVDIRWQYSVNAWSIRLPATIRKTC